MVGAQSVTDLSTVIRKTLGQVPPSLVGCSVTTLGDKVYVFGGRLAATKQMTDHLYIMDLPSLVWHRHIGSPDSARPPCPRYFHSATVYRHFIVYFGGMNYGTDLSNINCSKRNTLIDDYDRTAKVYTLNDLYLFNTRNLTWIKRRTTPSLFTPRPRYAHISFITIAAKDKLVVMGGQDTNNDYVEEFSVLDLVSFEWEHGGSLDRPCGIYRTVPFDPRIGIEGLQHLPHSPDQQSANSNSSDSNKNPDFYLFANYNLSSDLISRELSSFDPTRPTVNGGFQDYDHLLSQQQVLPPGLRFPHGQVIGQHFVIAGTYLGAHSRNFQVWALHLGTLAWSRIDTGSRLENGAWGRGLVYSDQWILFGNRNRDIYKAYGQREINFDDMVTINLEAYGVYTTPVSTCDRLGYDLGLTMLHEPNMADVYVVTTDDRSIPANLQILSLRWPYVSKLIDGMTKDRDSKGNITGDDETEIILGGRQRHHKGIGKTMLFPETYAVTLAFLQYIYTDNLMTVQQHQPTVLARLLILADMYQMPRLKQLSTHALHQILSVTTASLVYETATLTNQYGLQVRALRLMINTKKSMERQQKQYQSPSSPDSPASSAHPLEFLSSPLPSIPPPPTPTSPCAPSIASSTFLSDCHHDDFFTFSSPPPPPLSSPTSSTTTQKNYYPHLVPLTSTQHHDSNNPGSAVYLVRKKSSPRSLSSGSSTTSSSNDDHLVFHMQQQSAMKTPHSFKDHSNGTSGNGKFSWRKLQQSTIALAKPKPLRVDASNAQPFYDL
ncbi:hypothetical protein BCR42DRAFT_404802 [Absidia repens]|uniref:Uncharacterized protein n=1 Tax=Absidia repens TaxID=90262 RepID=A0A1X2IWM7_9FUNG|nr:hypothetical protein BCR42DRAFT_404802 [Absidia repens]